MAKGKNQDPNKQKKKQKQALRRVAVQRGRNGVVIAECTKHYALALSDPFALKDSGALPCVPDTIVLPSYKFGVYARTVFEAGGSGIGYVMVNPWAPFNNSVSSTYPFITHTQSSSLGLSTAALNSFTNTVNVDPQSPITWGQYNSANADAGKLRCVGLAIRITDVTASLYSQGRVALFRHPSNGGIGAMSTNQILNMPETEVMGVSRGTYHTVLWKPLTPEALGYQYASGAAAGPSPGSQLGVMCIGGSLPTSGYPQTYEVEIVGFYEAVGASTAQTTASHSDPVGISKTLQVISNVGYSSPRRKAPHAHSEGVFDKIGHAIADGASGLIHAGSDALGSTIRMLPQLGVKAAMTML